MPPADQPALSIIIPTLNEAGRIGPVLDALGGGPADLIIADGGSADDTCRIATGRGARIVATPPGRGRQLAAGAAAAAGRWLLFLHADTRLSEGWRGRVETFMADPENRRRAAVFQFRLDDDGPSARRLEGMVAWRSRAFGLPYGDQGLLISRDFYDRLGGFRALPLMEDVDLARRIGGGRITVLDAVALTSAERYRRGGYILRPLRNLLCLGLFFLGLPPRILERLYR